MNITKLEEDIKKLVKNYDRDTFIYELLKLYETPKSTVKFLKPGGRYNMSEVPGEVSWKKKLFYKITDSNTILTDAIEIADNLKHQQRFVILTNFKTFVAIDTKVDDKIEIEFSELYKHYDFFFPFAGIEKADHQNENPADVKAAEKMAKLFDEIRKDNPNTAERFLHELNIFFTRLLFCFFAEDTDIFEDSYFTKALDNHTKADGSDLNTYLDRLFRVLDTPNKDRKELPDYLDRFPYVNGGLFREKIRLPKFSTKSRKMILDSGDLDWKDINPDIFGSMIQAVVRGLADDDNTKHYTSVPNIMKVISPLFLDELYEEFYKAEDSKSKLKKLLIRIYKLKIFDPACGSGNFLIIAYKELRSLEMKILQKLSDFTGFSNINLSQFYGIELNETACEVAKLSLWLAKHQMDHEYFKISGIKTPPLPLNDAGVIVKGNACRIDWEDVCPKEIDDEIYILGNPPYLGARLQSQAQKDDMKKVFHGFKKYNNLDYIACWFKLATDYADWYSIKYAFVTTNSINQGDQVSILWPYIAKKELSIFFVHKSFKWTNNAKGKAGVTVSIIGVCKNDIRFKRMYKNNFEEQVSRINAYLLDAKDIFVVGRSSSISNLPQMCFGSMANDGGHLLLSAEEKKSIIASAPSAEKYIKRLYGSLEFIRGIEKYCLWIEDTEVSDAIRIKEIKERIDKTKQARLNSKRESTNKLASEPHAFGERRYKKNNAIIVPRVSSETRDYIPLGFLTEKDVISDSAHSIYDAEPWLLGVLSSKIHMAWVKTVAGRLKTDFRYSSTLVYNTFPFPNITEEQKKEIKRSASAIIREREKHSEKTLAELYDPDKMPQSLRDAHTANDEVIERCYRAKPFESDEERLEHLFKLYEKMIEAEQYKDTLFEQTKPKRKGRKKK